jgi:putative ABC transport system permease protein
MMKPSDLIKLSTRMFRTRPARTWLTICGIGVGIAAVVVLVGLGFGLQNILLEQIVFGDALLSLNVMTPPSKVVVIDDSRVDEFLKIDNVDDVSPLASFNSLITMKDLTGSIILQGCNTSYFRYAGIAPKEGDLLTDSDNSSVVITTATLKLFDMDAAQIIGQPVKFKVFLPIADTNKTDEVPLTKEYKIKGIVNDESTIAAYILLSEFSSNFKIPYYEKARVKVSSNEFLNIVEGKVIEKGFLVTSLSKTVDQANKIFQGIQVMLALFGGIALIVSAIGMFNTMTVTLLERTKEIGIMRTIGGSPLNIKLMFLTESILMGFLGGMVGILIGVGGGLTINVLLNFLATRMGGQSISLFSFPIVFLLFIAGFSAVMGFLTGLFPSNRAAKLNPLDAIRYS